MKIDKSAPPRAIIFQSSVSDRFALTFIDRFMKRKKGEEKDKNRKKNNDDSDET